MPRPEPTTTRGRDTRNRIINAAMTLIRERGVAEVTIDDVQDEAGVGRSQMYHYFDGRDDLVRAVVDATVDAVLGEIAEESAELDSSQWFDRWFTRAELACAAVGGVGGCPIGSLVGQLVEHDESARRALTDAFDRWLAHLAAGLARLRDNGHLQVDTDVDELADYVMATLQGGLLLAQVFRDPDRLQHALDGVRFTLSATHA